MPGIPTIASSGCKLQKVGTQQREGHEVVIAVVPAAALAHQAFKLESKAPEHTQRRRILRMHKRRHAVEAG